MRRIRVAPAGAIKPGQAREITLLGRKYAVFNANGALFGLEGSCKHMKASLAHGRLDGEIVTCYMHDWKFNIRDGSCLSQDWARLKTYPVEITDGQIFILIEEGESA